MRNDLCVLIPVHNEEKTLAATLQSVSNMLPATNMYVVIDGSTDMSYIIAKKYTSNVLNLEENVGKASALNNAVKHFQLAKLYRYTMLIDADTIVDQNFYREFKKVINRENSEDIICVVGRVAGRSHNWLTLYRVWEYELSQSVHKSAQNIINAIVVCSGCASVYRSEILDSFPLPSDTVAEDMDYTFLLHRKKMGKIIYTEDAFVTTQDPQTIQDYLKQIDRWYTGFWQCIMKHNIPWGGQPIDLEVGMLAFEGLFNSLVIALLLALLPVALIEGHYWLIVYPFMLDFGLFLLPTLTYTVSRQRLPQLFMYIPLYYCVRFLSSLCFFVSFMKLVLFPKKIFQWAKVTRYNVLYNK